MFDFKGSLGSLNDGPITSGTSINGIVGVAASHRLNTSAPSPEDAPMIPEGMQVYYMDGTSMPRLLQRLHVNLHRSATGIVPMQGTDGEDVVCMLLREPINGTWSLDHTILCSPASAPGYEDPMQAVTPVRESWSDMHLLRGPAAWSDASELGIVLSHDLSGSNAEDEVIVFNASDADG